MDPLLQNEAAIPDSSYPFSTQEGRGIPLAIARPYKGYYFPAVPVGSSVNITLDIPSKFSAISVMSTDYARLVNAKSDTGSPNYVETLAMEIPSYTSLPTAGMTMLPLPNDWTSVYTDPETSEQLQKITYSAIGSNDISFAMDVSGLDPVQASLNFYGSLRAAPELTSAMEIAITFKVTYADSSIEIVTPANNIVNLLPLSNNPLNIYGSMAGDPSQVINVALLMHINIKDNLASNANFYLADGGVFIYIFGYDLPVSGVDGIVLLPNMVYELCTNDLIAIKNIGAETATIVVNQIDRWDQMTNLGRYGSSR